MPAGVAWRQVSSRVVVTGLSAERRICRTSGLSDRASAPLNIPINIGGRKMNQKQILS